MLDIKLIRENPDYVKAGIRKREMNLDQVIDDILTVDKERREATGAVEAKKAEQNAVSKEIPKIKKAGGDTSEVLARMKALADEIKEADAKLDALEAKQKDLMLSLPNLPDDLRVSELKSMDPAQLGDLMNKFIPMQNHFNRYLMIGGFPELVLSDDDVYAQRMLREDVVDKVIKRDVLSLFNIRSPLLMEKLFLYLCMNSTEIFNATTAAKELENTSITTIESYIKALEMSNLIYLAKPMDVGSKGALKGKPKIFIADAAIRNAVLMIDDVLSDEKELGAMVETTVYKHMVSFYQGSTASLGYFRKAKDNQKEVDVVVELPRQKILCEVKYRNHSHIAATDAIVELCQDEKSKVTDAFLITKRLDDFGITQHETMVPILRVPAIAFLYILGKTEAEGQNGKL